VNAEHFGTTFRLGAPPAEVFAFLLDPHSYIEMAPLVVTVRDIRTAGDTIRYVSVERFRLGPLHWDNPIDVTMTPVSPGRTLRNSVISPGRIRLTATVDLVPAGEGGSSVTETIEVWAPRYLRSFTLRKAREAQEGRVAALTARFPA
jgi:carbon monoxide dehydrogenase subunit G